MYIEQLGVELPEDPHAIIWRYCDLAKLVSLLDKKELFFPTLEALDDRYEGFLTGNTLTDALKHFPAERPRKNLVETWKNARKQLCVNSWHMNTHESAAMWKLYLKRDEGVAIRSTFSRLTNCFARAPMDVFVAKVKYIDYAKDLNDPWNVYKLGLWKRKSFEHENELRAVVMTPDVQVGGIYVPCDVSTLIDEVYVAPSVPEYFVQSVKAVCDRFDIKKNVLQSNLDAPPPY